MIEDTIRANSLRTVKEVTNYTKAGGGCSSCHEGIEEILEKVMAEQGESFDPAARVEKVEELVKIQPVPAIAATKPASMTPFQRMKRIEMILESIRPTLQADGGDVELVDVDGKTIYVNMSGACCGCQMAAMTLGGIQQRLMEDLGEFIKVVPASQMPKTMSSGG